MNYEQWRDKYNNYRYIDIINFLSKKHIDTARKLGIEIEDKLYTQRELEVLHLELSAYYKDEDITKEELELLKSLDGTGVTEQELNELVNKIEEITKQYENNK